MKAVFFNTFHFLESVVQSKIKAVTAQVTPLIALQVPCDQSVPYSIGNQVCLLTQNGITVLFWGGVSLTLGDANHGCK